MVQRRRHLHPTAHRNVPIRKLNVRSATPETFGHGEPVAVVVATGVEGVRAGGIGESADRAIAFGPCRAFVGSEKAGFFAFVGWASIADVLGYGERRQGSGEAVVACYGHGCGCWRWKDEGYQY